MKKKKIQIFLVLFFLQSLFFLLTLPVNALLDEFSCVLNSFQSEGVVSKISTGLIPIDVAINPVTNRIYISNFGDNTVSVIDGSNDSVISTISVGNSPYGISVNKKTNKIYVANQNDDTISVIDGETNNTITTVSVGMKPIQIAVNHKTNKIYVVNQNSNSVSVIDSSNDSVINTVSVGDSPFGVEVNTETNKIYVANYISNSISVIDGSTDTVLKIIDNLGESTYGVTVDEENNKIYAFSLKGEELLGRGFLFKIDGLTDSVIENYIIGSNGTDIALHPATKKVYITHTFNSVIDGYDTNKKQLLCLITEVISPSGIAVNSKTGSIYICNNDLSSATVVKDSEAKVKDGKGGEKPEKPKEESPEEPLVSSPALLELKDAIFALNEIQADLKNDSKFARPITSRLGLLINKINIALDSGNRCDGMLKIAVRKLSSIIPRLESKSCSETRLQRCIPAETVDEFIISLEEQFEIIDLAVETDDNENMVSDVCEKQ